jgi:hypothetical protein
VIATLLLLAAAEMLPLPTATPEPSALRDVTPRATPLPVYVLDPQPAASCSLTPLLARLPGCRPATVSSVRATGTNAARAAAAADRNACSAWNSQGFPPQRAELTLAEPVRISALLFVPAMTPVSAPVEHDLLVRAPHASHRFALSAVLTSEVPYIVVFPWPIETVAIDVQSTASPSWIAWTDLVPLACDGPVALPSTLAPVEQQQPVRPPVRERFVPGRGACKTDRDCAMENPCYATTCVSAEKARRPPKPTSCPDIVNPFDQGGRCACVRGTCGAFFEGGSP